MHKSPTASRGASAASSASATARGLARPRLERSLCAFWLADRCFGLDVALVAEVVAVESVTPVPLAREALRGIMNLRGTPVALVDLAAVLGLAATGERRAPSALVVKSDDLLVGLLIDRMESVVAAGQGAFTEPTAPDEHPVVRGFLEVSGLSGLVVTVLDAAALVKRLDALRYQKGNEQ